MVGPLVALVVALGVVVTPFVLSYSAMQAIGITPGPNQVSNWAAWNYSGYQGKAAYPEYRALVETMERVGATARVRAGHVAVRPQPQPVRDDRWP